jgi:hypothetical protein
MLAAKGNFGKGNIEEWETSTDFKHLPEHVAKNPSWHKAAVKVGNDRRRRRKVARRR